MLVMLVVMVMGEGCGPGSAGPGCPGAAPPSRYLFLRGAPRLIHPERAGSAFPAGEYRGKTGRGGSGRDKPTGQGGLSPGDAGLPLSLTEK